MNAIQILNISTTIVWSMVGVFVFSWIYNKEIKYPERILVKKIREGSLEVITMDGKLRKKKSEDEKSEYLELYLKKDKVWKALDPRYKASITTGFIGRKKRFWELCSPRIGEYFFVEQNVGADNIKYEIMSSTDKEHFINTQRASVYMTEKPEKAINKVLDAINKFAPLITVIAIFLLITLLEPKIISMFEKGAQAFVDKLGDAVSKVNNTVTNL